MFEPYLKSFYVRSTDPTMIKILKVCMLLFFRDFNDNYFDTIAVTFSLAFSKWRPFENFNKSYFLIDTWDFLYAFKTTLLYTNYCAIF